MKKFLKHTEEKKTIPKEEVDSNIAIPEKAKLKELYQIALDGNMDRISAYLDDLEQKNEKQKGFCDQVGTHALSFQNKEILCFLFKKMLLYWERDGLVGIRMKSIIILEEAPERAHVH